METFPVIIAGAGPSGLTLALSLASHKVSSIILEREAEITNDPRGVYLSGDSVRVLWNLGVQTEFSRIGHEQQGWRVHKGCLTVPAFLEDDVNTDWRNQAIPDAVMQIQPELERVLREKINASKNCQLRCGCEVVSVEQMDEKMRVAYRQLDGTTVHIDGSWLVGADGKRGFVRKHYLEPVAGVQQEPGLFAYEGTWIAANLHITLPTPETHPDFAPWKAGLSPEEVYDLYWPQNVHFVSPPGKPTACMRFGPREARLWRHEFAQLDWDDSMDAERLLWEHLLPMVSRDHDEQGRTFAKTTFPQDCIEVKRCAPYAFSQKVVNKWFHGRTVLIGDAAHVFPPFAGQGITAGIRDAQALAWRLAMFETTPNLQESTIDDMLSAWASERKRSIDDSARITKLNGRLVNEAEGWTSALLRTFVTAIENIPGMPRSTPDIERADREAYKSVKNGFFSDGCHGGEKIAQIYLKQAVGPMLLSDEMLKHDDSLMTVLVLDSDNWDGVANLIEKMDMPRSVVSKQSMVQILCNKTERTDSTAFSLCPLSALDKETLRKGYSPDAFMDRLGLETKYAIIRPDFIIHSTARSIPELGQGLQALKARLGL